MLINSIFIGLRNAYSCRFSSRLRTWNDFTITQERSITSMPRTCFFKLSADDYAVLESYQKLIGDVAHYVGVDVAGSFAVPGQNLKLRKLKASSTIVDSELILKNYQRIVQINFTDSASYAILLRFVEGALPRGTKLQVENFSEDIEELRFVPDRQLIDLKTQLDSFQSLGKKKS